MLNGTTGSFSTGWFGAAGPVSLDTRVLLNTGNTASAGAGTLNLIGTITQSGTAGDSLVKTGVGSLILGGNNSATFTGDPRRAAELGRARTEAQAALDAAEQAWLEAVEAFEALKA